MDQFDPYHKWLGIPRNEQPPNHYRLLGIALFEADPEVIESAADRQMKYVSQCATGDHQKASQRLLNELSAARVCLLVATKREAYDAQLKAALSRNQQIEQSMKPVPLDEPEFDFRVETIEPPVTRPRTTPSKSSSRRTSKAAAANRPKLEVWHFGAGAAAFVLLMVLGYYGQSPRKPDSSLPTKTPAAGSAEALSGSGMAETAMNSSSPGISAPPTVSSPPPVSSLPKVSVSGEPRANVPTLQQLETAQNPPMTSPLPPQNPDTIERKPLAEPIEKVPSPDLDLDQPLQILEASYGAGQSMVDLTDRIRAVSNSGMFGVVVDNGLLNRDPAPGVPKWFKVRYGMSGIPYEQSLRDFRSIFVLDRRPPARVEKGLKIREAWLGNGILGEGTWIDLASKIQGLVKNDRLEMSIASIKPKRLAPGVDPKVMIMRWSYDDQTWTSPFHADDTIRIGADCIAVHHLNSLRGEKRVRDPHLVILEAQYGAKGTWMDLTDRVRQSAEAGFVALVANGTMGVADPVPNETKTMRVRYQLDGQLHDELYHEGSFVYIDGAPLPDPAPRAGLVILHAICGQGINGEESQGGPAMMDVTRRLQDQVRDNRLEGSVNDLLRGASPFRGRTLAIRYALDGTIHFEIVDGNSDVRIGK